MRVQRKGNCKSVTSGALWAFLATFSEKVKKESALNGKCASAAAAAEAALA